VLSSLSKALTVTMSRRRMLAASLGLTVMAVVAACTGTRSGLVSSPSPGAGTTPSPTPNGNLVPTPECVVKPAETEGPYFVDERLNRSDITTDPSGGPARTGVPLTLVFNVARVNSTSCSSLGGAQVDVWHCDALGVYSDVSAENTVGKKYLRGYQVTDAEGAVRFQTIYPGWYSGRAVHIHFKIRTFLGSQKTYEFTSQVFLDDSVTDEVYKQVPYNSRGSRNTRNATDMVYTSNGNSGSKLLVNLARTASGYTATFSIGLQLA
jgi:protocatechuate 3,4-dioxygenase beta subunit